MAKEIEVVISPDGTLSIEAINFEGTTCEKDILMIELSKLLQKENLKERKKPEYYRATQQKRVQR